MEKQQQYTLETLEVYLLAMGLSEKIWQLISNWDSFSKSTIGKQLLRSVDSIAANISEGYGRYFHKENRQFCFYARGSVLETKTWLTKAKNRKLMDEELFRQLITELELVHIKLNAYIKHINKSKKD